MIELFAEGAWQPRCLFNGGDFAKFRLTAYGRLVQILLTWILPFAFTSYFPRAVLLGKT